MKTLSIKPKAALTKAALMAAVMVAVLSACGGDDDSNDTPAPTSSVPESASQSATGFIDYLKLLVASSADTLEPVDVANVTPPADEVSEPQPVN